MPEPPRIALLIESTRAYGRALLHGIATFLQSHGPWSIFHQERGLGDALPAWLRRWTGDGIIARLENPRLIARVRKMNIPTVDLRGRFDIPDVPAIDTDDRAVVRLAIEHLAGRGLRRFAYCGFTSADYSERRLAYFREMLKESGFEPDLFEGVPPPQGSDTVTIEAEGFSQEKRLAQWLRSLARPVGILACNDIRAQQVLNTCRALQIAVPDDIAVLGVDNDELLCNLSYPPLSSVEPDAPGIGYQAAAMLDRMLHGEVPGARKVLVAPRGVVVRASTAGLAIPDRQVATAVRFIRENACGGIDVGDVLAQVALSRSTLERRFKHYLSRSPKEEILRVRLGRVKQLLTETDYSLATIARRTGFHYVEHLSALFLQKVRQTPGEFRQLNRAK